LIGHDGRLVVLEAIRSTDRILTVYNVEVDSFHTYYVGGINWGFSVWVHNASCSAGDDAPKGIADGDLPSANIAGLSVSQAKHLESEILRLIPGSSGVRVFGSRTRGVSTSDIDVVVKMSEEISKPTLRAAIHKIQDVAKKMGIPKPENRPRVDVNVASSFRSFLRWSSEVGDQSRGLPRIKRME
jgi:predicted nucleotidyltransferase